MTWLAAWLVTQRLSGAATRIVRAVEPVSTDRITPKLGSADKDRRYVIGRFRILEPMPHTLHPLARIRRKRVGLCICHVRQPLLMDAGGIDGFLNVHLEIDDVHDRLQNSRNNPASARRAENEDRLAVPRHDRWSHRTPRRLARHDGVGIALDNSVTIGGTWVWREVVHFVIHQNACA